MFKKSFWIPYKESDQYPTLSRAVKAVSEYCEKEGSTYIFTDDDTVVIDGREYSIYRGIDMSSRGNYGIKCKEK